MLARRIYTLLLNLLLPFVVARLWWRGRDNPGYRQRIRERFGVIPHCPSRGSVWIHAVSVGELLAAAPLIKAHLRAYPNRTVVVTTTTPTGSAQVKRLFAEGVFHMYMPYDIPRFLRRFLNSIKPSLLIIMETELWPNVINACHEQNIPVMLANARLSDKSASGYAKIRSLVTPMLQQLHTVVAQHELDGERFVALGLPKDNLTIMSNIKFDISVPDHVHEQGAQLRDEWGCTRKVVALASSHEGEDEQLLEHLPTLHNAFPDAVLMLIPRHPERFDAVANKIHRYGYKLHRRSQGVANTNTQVYLADSMGEMLRLLAAADVVIMGGSLIEKGGHNPIEPAALGKPVFIGPHYVNFESIVQDLRNTGALSFVDVDHPFAGVIATLNDDQVYDAMSSAGINAVSESKGTVDALLALSHSIITQYTHPQR